MYMSSLKANVLRDRTGKQTGQMQKRCCLMPGKKATMASFSRSAVHAMAMNPYSIVTFYCYVSAMKVCLQNCRYTQCICNLGPVVIRS